MSGIIENTIEKMVEVNTVLVMVYGSLLSNHGNNKGLGLYKYPFTTDSVKGFKLYTLGGFPGIKASGNENDVVHGEVYEVPLEYMRDELDNLEGYDENRSNNTFYNRIKVTTELGQEVFIYEYVSHIPEDRLVTSGNWRDVTKVRANG